METNKCLMMKLFTSLVIMMSLFTTAARADVKYETATFANGSFMALQPVFEKLDGVKEVVAGYAGGTGENPGLGDYAAMGYVQGVQVTYDPNKITYSKLLDVFWRQIDPTDAGGQFIDRGPQYRAMIFYGNPQQKELAENSKEALARSGRFDKPIVIQIMPASTFYKAESYLQDFYKKNPYKYGRTVSGRIHFMNELWQIRQQ